VIPLQEEVIRRSPRDPGIGWRYNAIGTVHMLQSRIDEAIIWFEKARAAVPDAPGVHARLAAAYALKSETERAASELAESRRLSPDDRFSSIARLSRENFGVPKVHALYDATVFTGLRKAGMPEE
jgi:tetratricopeptide (TPR) repeat protein